MIEENKEKVNKYVYIYIVNKIIKFAVIRNARCQ